jgi:hypothetical protein
LASHLTGRFPILAIGLLFILTSVPLSGVAVASANPMIRVGNGDNNSVNWSGYAVTGAADSITVAQGSWTVPAVTCASGEKSYSAFWVGIDGFSSTTVEQTGTDSDCAHGAPTYYAWFEFYPKASKDISTLTIHPGDEVAARVTFASGTFRIAIEDFTTGKAYSSTSKVSGAMRSSAEFIVEAPETCVLLKCSLTKLSDFGTTGFGSDNTGITAAINCAVAMNGPLASLGSYGSAVQEITMVGQSNSSLVKSLPSALSADGTSFTVQWMNAGP